MRLIDADKINTKNVIGGTSEFADDIRQAMQDLIDGVPTVDAKPVRYAKRIVVRSAEPDRYGCYGYHPECSECGDTEAYGNYCSNCGAKFIGNNFVDEEKQNNISRGDKDAATD